MNTVVTSREAILAASRQIASSEGLNAINMRAVAKACGVAVGSVYNYFPSKADLMAATVEDIWRSIFHKAADCGGYDSFCSCIEDFFTAIRNGLAEHPAFFAAHSLGFEAADRKKGREMMEQYYIHIQNGFLEVLKRDCEVKDGVFDSTFCREDFVEFVFSNILTLLVKNEPSCRILTETVKRILY